MLKPGQPDILTQLGYISPNKIADVKSALEDHYQKNAPAEVQQNEALLADNKSDPKYSTIDTKSLLPVIQTLANQAQTKKIDPRLIQQSLTTPTQSTIDTLIRSIQAPQDPTVRDQYGPGSVQDTTPTKDTSTQGGY